MASLMPQGKQRYTDNNGNNLSGGKLWTYAAGTTTPLATYSDQAGTTPNANPVVLNARGEATIFWGSAPYKAKLTDASDVEIWTQDNMYAPAAAQDVSYDFAIRVPEIANYSAIRAYSGTLTAYYVRGVSSIFDGGHGIFRVDSSDTTSADNGGTILIDASSRRWRREFSAPLNVKWFGATGDGVTNDETAIEAAMLAATGSTLRIPEGDYLIGGNAAITLTGTLEILMESDARLVGGSGTATPVLTVNGGASRYGFKISGGQIDNSLRTYTGAGQEGTALELIRIDDFSVKDIIFGARTLDWPDNKGDSGITATECQRGTISGNWFYGQPDNGVYITGGALTATSDDYGDIVITGNHFVKCNNGVAAKRSIGRTVVNGNTFSECTIGVVPAEAMSGATQLQPGEAGVISGNTFRKTKARAVELRPGGGWVVEGNVIEDIGRDRALAAVTGYGILNSGSSNNKISGNIVRLREWANHTLLVGIISGQYTIDGVVSTPEKNVHTDNLITGIEKGIVEVSTGANYYAENGIFGATTAITGMNAATVLGFYDGTNGYRVFVGSTEVQRIASTYTFVKTLRFFDSATVATTPSNFSATRYFTVNANGSTLFVPAATAGW